MSVVIIPATLDELLSPEWLNDALAIRYPGVQITSVTPGPIVERVSTNARFTIEGELPPGLSSTLCAKGYFSDAGRVSAQASVPEVSFYRDLADRSGVRTLHSVWADVDPETQHGVVITEDVVAAGGAFLDTLTPCTVDQVAELLGQFALLHAHAWEHEEVMEAQWLAPRLAWILHVRGLKEISGNFEGPNGARVPDDTRDAHALIDGYARLSSRTPGPGWAVAHGDAHMGNTFLDGAGRLGLLDWQVTQYAPWGIDVGYHIASALEPDVRADNERDLLQHYLDALAAAGVANAPSVDEAWDSYRCGVVHGFFLWGITQFVTDDIIEVLLYRLGTAVSELESYRVLQVT